MRLIARYLTAALLAVALLAGWAAAAPGVAHAQGGATVTYNLWAKTGSISLPGASVPVWSYATTAGGAPGAIGPTLVATQGDTLVINLTNNLTLVTSLEIPGLVHAADTAGVAAGASKSYTFSNLTPGTYIYEAGVLSGNGPRQVAMGLVGALVVHSSAAGTAYGTSATAFDSEATLVYSEIDPKFNANPLGFKLHDFNPKYLLINGKVYPSTDAINVSADSTLLLRQVNAGVRFHSIGLLGLRQKLIADDAGLLPSAAAVVAHTIGAGQTVDSLVRIPASAVTMKYPLYDAGLPASGPSGANGMGGLLTFILAAQGGPAPTPSPTPSPSDTVAPTVSAVSIPSLSNSTTSLALTASASDNVALASATYTIDALAPVAFGGVSGASASLSASVNVSGLSDGSHTVKVTATDSSNNSRTSSSVSFKLDRGLPTLTASVSPATVNLGAATILSGSASDALSGIASASYKLDGGAAKPLTVGANGSISASISTAGLATGAHSVVVSAVDGAGNSKSTPAIGFTVSDTVFSDDFQGTLSQWSAVGGSNALSTLAGMNGTTKGLAVTFGSSSSYLQKTLAASENQLHVRFFINPRAQDFGTSAKTIFRASNGTSNEIFRLELQRVSASQYQVRAVVKNGSVTKNTDWKAINANAPSYVELAWQKGASASFQISVGGVVQQTLTSLNTNAYGVNTLRLGVQTSGGSGTKTIYVDEFKVTRSTTIGAN